jgi:hypothetical protein
LIILGFHAIMWILQQCPDGYYSAAKASTCSQCPAGQKCFDGSNYINPTNCDAGYYSLLGDSSCTACAAGNFIVLTFYFVFLYKPFKHSNTEHVSSC